MTLPAAQALTLHVQTTVGSGTTEVVVAGENGDSTVTVGRGASGTDGLSAFAGGDVTIEFVPADIEQLFITRDSDGDDIPDSVEAATQRDSVRLPQGTGSDAYFSLTPASADTDGDGLSDDEEVTLDWSYDGSQAVNRLVDADDIDADRVLREVEELPASQQRGFARIVGRNDQVLVGDRVTPNDILTISRKGDLGDTEMAVKDSSGTLRWLEVNEGENVGYDKILREHRTDIVSQYPGIKTSDKIMEAIFRGIRNSDSVIVKPDPNGGVRYFVNISESDVPLRVVVSKNGFIINAFPDSGKKGMFHSATKGIFK